MGCTSSAPNTIPPNANTADKSMQSEEETNQHPLTEGDVADIVDENRTSETKVLPKCDTSEEPVQLVKNKKTSASLPTEKDVSANGHVIESENVFKTLAMNQDEVKKPKLELLIDKVFETNQHLNELENKLNENDNTPDLNNKVESAENNIEKTDAAVELEPSDSIETEIGNNTEGEEEPKDTSPTHSQCSRATRWEALADIAAELPPSLAVDPLTGQIYQIALTK